MTRGRKAGARSAVRQQYDRWAPLYDWLWRGYTSKTLSALKRWAEIAPSEVVLDVGCGTGEFAHLILEDHPSHEIIGVDGSSEMIAVARDKLHAYPDVRFEEAGASALPLPDNHVDVVVSASAFHYFLNPHAALREMRRVVKPEGRLLLMDWCRDYWGIRLLDAFLQYIDPAHHRCYRMDELEELLTANALHAYDGTRFRFGLVWDMMIVEASPTDDHPAASDGRTPAAGSG